MKNEHKIKLTLISIALIMALAGCAYTPGDYVGMVNKRPITIQEYNQVIRTQYESYMLKTEEVPNQLTMLLLNEKAWNNIVSGIVFEQQLQKFNIIVSNEEVVDYLIDNVPEIIENSKQFINNDVFDEEKYISSLKEDDPIELSWLVKIFYDVELPKMKLKERLQTLIKIPEKEIKNEFILNNSSARASVIHFDPTMFADIVVQESEIREYFNAHKTDFLVEPLVSLDYIIVPVPASAADTLLTKTRIDSVYAELKTGIDFRLLAESVSEGPTAKSGGELPFKNYQNLPSVIKNALTETSPNKYTDPINIGDGWGIYQVVSQTKNLIKLREIFIPHKISENSRKNVLKDILNIRTLASELGLSTAATEMGHKLYQVQNLSPVKDTVLPELGKSDSVIDRALKSTSGTIFEPKYRSDLQAYVLIEVVHSQPQKLEELGNVTDRIKDILFKKKQIEASRQKANEFYKKYKYDNIRAYANLNGFPISEFELFNVESTLSEEDSIVPLAKEMLIPRKNKYVSKPVEMQNGTYIGLVEKYNAADISSYKQQRESIRMSISEKRKDTFYDEWMKKQIKRASVKDWRR